MKKIIGNVFNIVGRTIVVLVFALLAVGLGCLTFSKSEKVVDGVVADFEKINSSTYIFHINGERYYVEVNRIYPGKEELSDGKEVSLYEYVGIPYAVEIYGKPLLKPVLWYRIEFGFLTLVFAGLAVWLGYNSVLFVIRAYRKKKEYKEVQEILDEED